MNPKNMSVNTLLRRPSAWFPLLLSVAALALLLGYVAVNGASQEPAGDEGPAARLFQLLLVAQLPFMAIFALRWAPRSPVNGMIVLALQIALAVVAVGTVIVLES